MPADTTPDIDAQPLEYRPSAFQGWIGIARRDITPPVGIYSRSWGAAKHDTAHGIHRPLTATVFSLSNHSEEPPFLLVAIDGGAWSSPDIVDGLRHELSNLSGSAESCILICLAHTHAGAPLFLGGDYGGFPGGELASEAFDKLRQGILEAAKESINGRVLCDLTWNYGRCALAANRELPEPQSARFLVSFNPERSADDQLLVGRVTDSYGRVRGTLVNYACHPTTMAWENQLISPDYVGAMRELVESHTNGAICMFLQGASGELSPLFDFSSDPDVADAQGRQLGFAVLSIVEGMLPPGKVFRFNEVIESGTPLGQWKLFDAEPSRRLAASEEKLSIELKPELATTKRLLAQLKSCEDRVMSERIRRQIGVRRWVGEDTHAEFPIWVWQIGDALLVAQSGEAYSSLQISLRKRFPERAVAVLNLVNGSPAYLPPADRYDTNIYAVTQTPYSRGVLEVVEQAAMEACLGLLRSGSTIALGKTNPSLEPVANLQNTAGR